MHKLIAISRALAVGGMLGCALYVVADTARLWIEGPAIPPPASNGAPPVPAEPGRGGAFARPEASIEAWHLFGEYRATQDPAVAGTLPETALQLELLGTFASDTDQDWAIIRDGDGAATLYRVGEDIGDDARIRDVTTHYVLLEHRNRQERLPLLPWDDLNGLQEIAREARDADDDDNEEEKAELPAPRSRLLSHLGVEPVAPDSASGYRVIDEEGTLVDKHGFKIGDVIVSVNGYPLGTLYDDQMAYTSFSQSGVGNIIVRRGATQFMLEYDEKTKRLKNLDALSAE